MMKSKWIAVFMVTITADTPVQALRDICMTEYYLEMQQKPYCKTLQEKRIKDYKEQIQKLEKQ